MYLGSLLIFFSKFIYQSIYLPMNYLATFLSIYLSIYLSIKLLFIHKIYLYIYNDFLATFFR